MSRNLLLVLSLALCTVLIGVFTNIGTGYLPEWVKPYRGYAWPALAITVLLLMVLLVIDKRSQQTAPPVLPDQARLKRNRLRMLARVRHDWIGGVLNQSLYQAARIDLGLEDRPGLVDHPLTLVVQEAAKPARLLPLRTKIRTVFDAHSGSGGLLILGAPGGGKTTLLLELAQDLLDRAGADEAHPIPVVFNLSSWALRRPALADWLADELNQRHDVPRKLAQQWVTAEQILPLLDGLDEVAAEHRNACVERINEYRNQHFLPMAVCSRTKEYESLSRRLRLPAAVVVQPLTRAEVEEYLERGGNHLAGVRAAVAGDETLWELLDTPLMLSIAMLAYQGVGDPGTPAGGSIGHRRQNLFARYVDTMFDRRTKETRYGREQTQRWLGWLATSMTRLGQSVFQLESLGRDWLRTPFQQALLGRGTGLVSGLLGGLIVALSVSLSLGRTAGPMVGLGVGLDLGLMVGLGVGLIVGRFGAKPVDTLRWSWPTSPRSYWGLGLMVLGMGMFAGGAGFGVGLGIGLMMLLDKRLVVAQVDVRALPNDGTWRSGRNSLGGGLLVGLGGGLVVGLGLAVRVGLACGLAIGLSCGLAIGLFNASHRGGAFFLRHWVIRLLLWRSGYAPFQYVRFLDYAMERVFLRKVGGGYIFTHRMLMEYFASLAGSEV